MSKTKTSKTKKTAKAKPEWSAKLVALKAAKGRAEKARADIKTLSTEIKTMREAARTKRIEAATAKRAEAIKRAELRLKKLQEKALPKAGTKAIRAAKRPSAAVVTVITPTTE